MDLLDLILHMKILRVKEKEKEIESEKKKKTLLNTRKGIS